MYLKMKKRSGGGVRSGGEGGQGGCVQRIEVIVKMQRKKVGGGGPVGGGEGVRGWMCTKNRSYCENAQIRGWELVGGSKDGVGGDVGYGECKPRIEGIDKCTMYIKVLYNIKNN